MTCELKRSTCVPPPSYVTGVEELSTKDTPVHPHGSRCVLGAEHIEMDFWVRGRRTEETRRHKVQPASSRQHYFTLVGEGYVWLNSSSFAFCVLA